MRICPKYEFNPEKGGIVAKAGQDCPYKTTMYNVLEEFTVDRLQDLQSR
jgi:hypothetical protein